MGKDTVSDKVVNMKIKPQNLVNSLIEGDCLKVMKNIPDGFVDLILCDLPYGTTQNSWDSIIPFEDLWRAYRRVVKPNGAIVLTAQSPFDKVLACSNLKDFRYEWIWEKNKATGHLNAKRMPMKAHENLLIFYQKFASKWLSPMSWSKASSRRL